MAHNSVLSFFVNKLSKRLGAVWLCIAVVSANLVIDKEALQDSIDCCFKNSRKDGSNQISQNKCNLNRYKMIKTRLAQLH